MSTWPSPVTVGTPPADGDVPTFDAATREWTAQHGGGGATGPTGATGGTGPTGATGSGTSGQGSPVVRAFPFAFDTPDILTGAALYTPTVGDILLDAWIEIDTAWDGAGSGPTGGPLGDFGSFLNVAHMGWFQFGGQGAVDMTQVDSTAAEFNDTLISQSGGGAQPPSDFWNSTTRSGTGLGQPRQIPAKIVAANPIKICVSQDGTNTGADPGSSVGSAVLYLVTATPV